MLENTKYGMPILSNLCKRNFFLVPFAYHPPVNLYTYPLRNINKGT